MNYKSAGGTKRDKQPLGVTGLSMFRVESLLRDSESRGDFDSIKRRVGMVRRGGKDD